MPSLSPSLPSKPSSPTSVPYLTILDITNANNKITIMFLLKKEVKNPTNKNITILIVSPATTHINKLIKDTINTIYNTTLLYNKSVFNKFLLATFKEAFLYKSIKNDFAIIILYQNIKISHTPKY